MNLINYNTVFCDWLDVTYSPEEDIISDLIPFLVSASFTTSDRAFALKQSWYPSGDENYGIITFEVRGSWVRVSASGGACSYLRHLGHFIDYLALLSCAPHTVTRLDLAYDLEKDFPDVLHGLRIHHPSGKASFTRKLSPMREYLAVRADGAKTGTLYIGLSRSIISARVYDKQNEILDKRKMLSPVCTRYEITFRKCSSLKDALDCAPLFWSHSEVLKINHLKPSDVPDWIDGSGFTGWHYERPAKTDFQRLENKIEVSGCLTDLVTMSDDLGPDGRTILIRLLTKHILA